MSIKHTPGWYTIMAMLNTAATVSIGYLYCSVYEYFQGIVRDNWKWFYLNAKLTTGGSSLAHCRVERIILQQYLSF